MAMTFIQLTDTQNTCQDTSATSVLGVRGITRTFQRPWANPTWASILPPITVPQQGHHRQLKAPLNIIMEITCIKQRLWC